MVAETLAQAMDAAEAVLVDYVERPPLLDPRTAEGEAPLWDQSPDNVCFRTDAGDRAAGRHGEDAMIASDLLDHLGSAIADRVAGAAR